MSGNQNKGKGKKNNNNNNNNKNNNGKPKAKTVTVQQVKAIVNQAVSTSSKQKQKKEVNSLTVQQSKQLDNILKDKTELNKIKCGIHCIPTKYLKSAVPGAGRYTDVLLTSTNTAKIALKSSSTEEQVQYSYKIDINISKIGPSGNNSELTKERIPDVIFQIARSQLQVIQDAAPKLPFVCKSSEQATTAAWYTLKTVNAGTGFEVQVSSASSRANIKISKPVRQAPPAISGSIEGDQAQSTTRTSVPVQSPPAPTPSTADDSA